MMLVVLAGAAKIIRGGEGRPSLRRTFLGLPLVVIGLSFPFFLEEGCLVPYNRSYVVTRDADAVLMKHGLVAWCPNGCVNVPREIAVRLTVRKNLVFRFEALFTVESPESLVRYLGLDDENRVVSSADVATAASRVLKPLLDGYFAASSDERSLYLVTSEKSIEELFRSEVFQQGNLPSIMTWGRWDTRLDTRGEEVIWRWVFSNEPMGLAFLSLRGKIVGVASQ